MRVLKNFDHVADTTVEHFSYFLGYTYLVPRYQMLFIHIAEFTISTHKL